MMGKQDELIRRYEDGIRTFEEAVKSVSQELLDRVPAPGKWTIRQIAHHLADSELVVATRFRWIAAEPGQLLKAFDQDKWAAALGYEKRDVSEALSMFRTLRQNCAVMLRALPESAWELTGKHEERGEVSLKKMVETYVEHAEHHARQIREIVEKIAPAAAK